MLEGVDGAVLESHSSLGLYVHIPFCRTRCPYCDFNRVTIDGAVPDAFVAALCREIAEFEGPAVAKSIFFGGGTPSLLDPVALFDIVDAVRARFQVEGAEFTMEANPDDVTPALTAAWEDAGVNRVSLGVQSFDDRVLRFLGRRHDSRTAHHACEQVGATFRNWAMDLIFGAHPVDTWDTTLRSCLAHQPPHVSTYGLTYETGTPFEHLAHSAIEEAVWLGLYREAETRLAEYDHYEISNYARPGFQCRHNLIYWHNEEYAGFGPGAFSFVNGVRAKNADDVQAYIDNPVERAESLELSEHEVRVETVIQHLRLESGLPREYYRQRFGSDVMDDFGGPLDVLQDRGLVVTDAVAIRPTRLGFELNNEIGLELVGPKA